MLLSTLHCLYFLLIMLYTFDLQLKKKYTFILDTQITQLIGTDNAVVETGNTKQET